MKTNNERRRPSAILGEELLHPAEMVLLTPQSQVITVVSYGVVVCLWDRHQRGAFMCHFLEPITREPQSATPRFGNVALLKGLEWMLALSTRPELEAQIIGGAQQHARDERGVQNLNLARQILSAKKINIASEDVGGTKGRKIIFDGSSGTVAVVKVHELRQGDWL